jgi:hypothetical protein
VKKGAQLITIRMNSLHICFSSEYYTDIDLQGDMHEQRYSLIKLIYDSLTEAESF